VTRSGLINGPYCNTSDKKNPKSYNSKSFTMSQGFSYAIQVNVLGSASFQNVIGMSERFENSIDKIHNKLDVVSKDIKAFGSNGVNSFRSMANGVDSMVARLGVGIATVDSLKKAADFEGLERRLNFTSGGKGAQEFAFLNETVDKYGLSLGVAADGYASFSASVAGTALDNGKFVKDMFTSMAEGSAVFALSSQKQQQALTAISKMASTGVIQADEFKQSFAEAFPGAASLLAKSLGMNIQEVYKAMEKGELVASTVLPKLAKVMHDTYGVAALSAAEGATANFNKFETAVLRTQVALGEHLLPTVIPFLENYLIPAVGWIGKHSDLILTLAGGYFGLKAATMALTTWQWLSNGAIAIGNSLLLFHSTALYFGGGAYGFYTAAKILATESTFTFTTALTRMNLAFLMSPVFWIPAAFVAVGAAIYYAWNKSETFRATVTGLGYAIIEFGTTVYKWFVQPLVAGWNILKGIFTGDDDLIKKGMAQQLDTLKSFGDGFSGAGKRLGDAYNQGWNKSMSDSKTLNATKDNGALGSFFDINSKGGSQSGGADDKTKKGIEAITGGGNQSRNVTISVNTLKVSDQMTIVNDANHNAPMQLTDELLKKLVQMLNSGNSVQLN
jgi:tape measure domain-containing protein